jgi:hypothetical protein
MKYDLKTDFENFKDVVTPALKPLYFSVLERGYLTKFKTISIDSINKNFPVKTDKILYDTYYSFTMFVDTLHVNFKCKITKRRIIEDGLYEYDLYFTVLPNYQIQNIQVTLVSS